MKKEEDFVYRSSYYKEKSLNQNSLFNSWMIYIWSMEIYGETFKVTRDQIWGWNEPIRFETGSSQSRLAEGITEKKILFCYLQPDCIYFENCLVFKSEISPRCGGKTSGILFNMDSDVINLPENEAYDWNILYKLSIYTK